MFSTSFFKHPLCLLLLFCLGCSAQSSSPEFNKRIERQVRAFYNVPASVQITIGERKASEFPNYDALPVTFDNYGRKNSYDFLISKDGKTLVRLTKIDISTDPYAETMKKIDLAGRPARGAKDSKVNVVVYDDFQCPYCAQMYRTLFTNVMPAYQDRVRVIFKDYPLFGIHPWAKRAAIDANCLAEQSNDAYWTFADYVHLDQKEVSGEKFDLQASTNRLDNLAVDFAKKHTVDAAILQACLKAQPDKALNASVAEADSLGVSATPTLFINGQRLEGAVDASTLRLTLDAALRDAGQPVPTAAETQKAAPAPATASTPATPNK